MLSRSPQSKCLIAAGGTAGHVPPSLAVAEALTARGVAVTFAGSPDRGEAGLVPYPFDAFPVEGIPRTLSLRLPRALLRAALAPLACLRILRRRRPDVVLGGGGDAAGPGVVAGAPPRPPAGAAGAGAAP